MKTIIQRSLPLNINYTLIDKKYIPIEQSAGAYCCDNCGKLIANIATVKNTTGDIYNIGFDCLETILINNSLLSSGDIAEYERVKKMIPKVLRFSKYIKEKLSINSHLNIAGIKFEVPTYQTDWLTFYWLQNNSDKSRDNDNIKLKDVDFDFVIQTIKNIFPKLTIC